MTDVTQQAPPADATEHSGIGSARAATDQRYPMAVLGIVGAALLWAYWNTLCEVAHAWSNPLYSHGYLVPAFAAVLVWMRWQPIRFAGSSERWAGLALLAAGLTMRLVSTHYGVVTPEMVSFVPSLLGVLLLVGGWSLLKWAGPAALFLLFMFPLPTFIQQNILERLQHVATVASTFLLQTLGVAAFSEGKVIIIGDLKMGVVDACSGLRMSTNLLALVVAVLLVTRRPWWDRLIILLSAIPIALACNIIRITVTALFHVMMGSGAVGERFHDWAGFAMMPLGLGILYLEIVILSRLVIEDGDGTDVAAAGIGLTSVNSPTPAGR